MFKSNYDLDLDLEAFRRVCFHSYALSWTEFVGGMIILYIVLAFYVCSLMHHYWSHPGATICCRKCLGELERGSSYRIL